MNVKAFLLLLFFTLFMTACGNRKNTVDESAKNTAKQGDITRPPVAIGAKRNIEVERDPDETISFEEWQRQQQQNTPE